MIATLAVVSSLNLIQESIIPLRVCSFIAFRFSGRLIVITDVLPIFSYKTSELDKLAPSY